MSAVTPADRPRSRYALAGILLGMGALHFALPRPFMRIVPPIIGAPRFWVYASGAAELVSGGLLLTTKTKHLGSRAAAATIAGVYPANIWMAMDAGAPTSARAVAAWIRVPAQVPLLLWALSHRRPHRAAVTPAPRLPEACDHRP